MLEQKKARNPSSSFSCPVLVYLTHDLYVKAIYMNFNDNSPINSIPSIESCPLSPANVGMI